jgi:hypothetical protein
LEGSTLKDIVYTLAPFQDDFINSDERVVSIIGAKGSGKAQPLTEPILTPNGWTTMGKLKVGDKVIGSDGSPTTITGVFPQGEQDVYQINMSDKTYTHSTLDHLWAVQTGSHKTRKSGFVVKTLEELRNDLKTSQGYNKWYLPIVSPIQYEEKSFPIPPYSLGVILGDGGITKPEVIISTKDIDILKRVSDECKIGYKYRSGCEYNLTNNERNKKGNNTNHLVTALREFGLIGTKSDKKFIPDEYLYGSVEQRIDLMRGLMDTDGYCCKQGIGHFTTTSRVMAEQFKRLCQSLGLTTHVRTKKSEQYLDSYNIRVNAPFNPFWISRKAYKFNKYATQGRTKSIESVEYIGRAVCQCISVDAFDSLYVTRDYILTHNTWSGARYICREIASQRHAQGLVMFNTLQQARDIYAQDVEPLLRDLNWPYHFNQQSLILKVFDTLIHFRSAEPTALERIESVAYHWGWADECSFYSPEALKTFVSRVRKGDARVRLTSMPDEPDNFMYSFIEGLEGKMYEIALKDNPDRKFADRYEKFLRATYSGAQLERFLSGKRVSLSGLGLFAVEPQMRIAGDPYDPNEDMMLCWDFNVEYRAVSAWQQTGFTADAHPIVTCVRSWQMKEPTVLEDAEVLCNQLRKHKGRIILHGDASGQSRTAMATDSMWKTVKEVFYANFENVRYIVPKSNPSVKDTIQCLNWAIRSGLVQFAYDERNVYMSLQGAKADKYGEIDKAKDYDGTSSAKSHEADTARYASWHFFSKLYPGKRGGLWIA